MLSMYDKLAIASIVSLVMARFKTPSITSKQSLVNHLRRTDKLLADIVDLIPDEEWNRTVMLIRAL